MPIALALDDAAFFDDRVVTRAAVAALSPRLDALRDRIARWRRGDPPSFLALPYAGLAGFIRDQAREVRDHYGRVVVLGIGGSSLGGEMLVRVVGGKATAGRVRFFDNIDPETLAELYEQPWSETLVLAVSKSGETAETLSQLLSLLPILEQRLGKDRLRRQVRVITENRRGALAAIAEALGLMVLPHPPVGGRYSVLSVVGLLPAAIVGVDIEALLAGARDRAGRCGGPDIEQDPALFQGATQYRHALAGRRLSVQMTYGDRLQPVMRWYRQLWAESLGKRDARGEPLGLTPVEAYGVTDQHSQLQLYLDGPDDKQFSFLTSPGHEGAGATIPARFAELPAVRPLAGHTVGELFQAEFEATRTTLTRRGRPNRTLTLDPRDPYALGELILLLEMETVVVAELLGVDPFDQPAVEDGKVLAREYLARRPVR